MAEFDDLRTQLSSHRRTVEAQRQEALRAHEAARQAERALAASIRTADPRHVVVAGGSGPLAQAARAARARAEQAAATMAELTAAETDLLTRFEKFSDPRDGLAQVPADQPVMLLPLRVETRFGTAEDGRAQLWVRVYPDDCLVDAFEPALSTQEVSSARAFWAAIWRAGGDEARERTAWRDLVAAHGCGRSGWVVRQYQPLNPLDKPAAADVLLIIVSAADLPDAARVYWEAVWRADGEATAQQEAYDDLIRATDADQAAMIAQQYRPVNFADPPPAPRTYANASVTVAVLLLTAPEDIPARRTSWSSAPRVNLLPERFVVVGYGAPDTAPLVAVGGTVRTPLVVGPDPNAPPDQQLGPVDDTLHIPDQLAWMFDFDKACAAGMALRVDLDAQQAATGFSRLIVLGVRLSEPAGEGMLGLQQLLEHHLYSRTGLEILPQGMPTNNTEKGGAGYSFRDDADATFDVFFRQTPQYTVERDPMLRRDGQCLADLVGLDHGLVQRIPHADGRDQLEARAMQIALWPGTLGYLMRSLLAPVFTEEQIGTTRAFFTRYVSGRGPVPALRVGRQPYGILPTTAFDRLTERGPLHAVLNRIDRDWASQLRQVSYVGQPDGDPHQILLDVLGLHPGSVEYHPVQSDSVAHKFFELAFLDYTAALALLDLFPAVVPLTLLRSLGYAGDTVPDLLNQVYRARQTPLSGPVVDDRPLSESEPVRPYAGNRNYLEWLVDAAGTGIERIQREQGFDGDVRPTALLYLLLRHAVQLGFHATAVRLRAAQRPGVSAELVAAAGDPWREPDFVHVKEAPGSESRYATLFATAPALTGSPTALLGDYIAANLASADTELREQIDSIARLSRTPTARLERLFAEHVDTVSYRLDAWKTGLLAQRLDRRRPDKGSERGGLLLGAVGWVEAVRPAAALTPATVAPDVAAAVNRSGDPPLMHDRANEGLIHAPSLNHATTAAVLRNGYLAHDGRLAVNLSSRRVRVALTLQEGMRGGQSLGALLGYRFERYAHDNGPAQVHDLIYQLRQAFPLVADQIAATAPAGGAAEESVAAMNVVDGRKLIEHVENNGQYSYPFGVPALPRRDAGQEAALTGALADIRDANDALADLVLAEGVHQAVLGNQERSAGTLDAFAKGGYPPEPEIVRTPRSGIGLTLRTAIHLPAAPPANPFPAIPLTPMAAAEPALNAWLASTLPDPDLVGCLVSFTDRATGAQRTEFISQAQLGLQPIDLVHRGEAASQQALTDLDDRILTYLYDHFAPRHDHGARIRYTDRVPGRYTWFELQPLLRSLRELTVAARPLRPADLVRHNDASSADQATATIQHSRVQAARDDLHDNRIPALDTLAARVADATVPIDDVLSRFATTVAGLAAYRLPQTGTGFVFEWRAGAYAALVDKLAARIRTWNDRLHAYQQRIDDYDAQPAGVAEADRLARLRAADIVISTRLTTPTPASGAYRLALDQRRTAFVAKRDALQTLIDNARATLAELLADIRHQLPLTEFDPDPFDLTADADEIDRFCRQLAAAADKLKADVAGRISTVDALLARHDPAGPAERVRLLQEAATVLFGEGFQLVPAITLPPPAAAELANAWRHSTSGDLTRHLTDPAGADRDFPVDDWLHGLARVRDKLHHWENALLLGQAFRVASPVDLTPLQLPYGPGEPWLALEIPDGYRIDSDRLLYTAHFAEPYDPSRPVVGLLVDEWTEVVPGTDETTGIALHFDRPNAEPPQAWLLALSPRDGGRWTWDDLLAVVNSTIDSAKRRAIEPEHLDSTAYSWFLPATTSAYTFPEISISNNLLRNVDIYRRMPEE
jgi:hypothetical protein